jgi:hypothetical protein
MSFKISDKVVCVDASNPKHPHILKGNADRLKEGAIYTVREVLFDGDLSGPGGKPFHGECGVRLTGIWSGTLLNGHEAAWTHTRFRKIDELKAESEARYYINHPELAPA